MSEETDRPVIGTRDVQERLRARGIDADLDTIQKWAARGYFSGAYRAGTGSRSAWLIPVGDVDAFTPPTRTRSANLPRNRSDRRRFDADHQAWLAEAYRQPWSTAYFTALRAGDAGAAAERAGVGDATIDQEYCDNRAFATHLDNLWRRRADLGHGGITPRPILTPRQIEDCLRHGWIDDAGGEQKVSVVGRAAFERARHDGFLLVPPRPGRGDALWILWWCYCELYGLPFLVQERENRWYVSVDLNLTALYDGDGRPRRLSDAFLATARRLARERFESEDSGGNAGSISWLYVPVERAHGLAQEIYRLYRAHFPTDPPPNPERFDDQPILPASAHPRYRGLGQLVVGRAAGGLSESEGNVRPTPVLVAGDRGGRDARNPN